MFFFRLGNGSELSGRKKSGKLNYRDTSHLEFRCIRRRGAAFCRHRPLPPNRPLFEQRRFSLARQGASQPIQSLSTDLPDQNGDKSSAAIQPAKLSFCAGPVVS